MASSKPFSRSLDGIGRGHAEAVPTHRWSSSQLLPLHADGAFAEVALRDLHVHARGLSTREGLVERGAELFEPLHPEPAPPAGLHDLLVARVVERRGDGAFDAVDVDLTAPDLGP